MTKGSRFFCGARIRIYTYFSRFGIPAGTKRPFPGKGFGVVPNFANFAS